MQKTTKIKFMFVLGLFLALTIGGAAHASAACSSNFSSFPQLGNANMGFAPQSFGLNFRNSPCGGQPCPCSGMPGCPCDQNAGFGHNFGGSPCQRGNFNNLFGNRFPCGQNTGFGGSPCGGQPCNGAY